MTANDLMMFLIDLHMEGNSLEDIQVSFREHGDADVESVTHVEVGLQREDGTPTEVMLQAYPLSESPESLLKQWFDSI
jgi:hypothetical protein